MNDTVAILMSTYNGAMFLEEQIESIQAQSYEDWHLYIRDDGSTDQTREIIKRYVQKDSRITFLEEQVNLGVVKSFFKLLLSTDAPYYMFCDQDDVWLENKVWHTLDWMKAREEKKKQPILIHTDLQVVDQELKVKATSMFDYQSLPTDQKSYLSAFIQNNVTGCTMMMNQQLKDLVVECDEILMHDWWFSLIGATFGEVYYLSYCDILYRQHGKNAVGAQGGNKLNHLTKRLKKLSLCMQGKDQAIGSGVEPLVVQAKAFLSIYGDYLKEQQKWGLMELTTLKTKSKVGRWRFLIKNKVTYGKKLMTLDLYLAILIPKREMK